MSLEIKLNAVVLNPKFYGFIWSVQISVNSPSSVPIDIQGSPQSSAGICNLHE